MLCSACLPILLSPCSIAQLSEPLLVESLSARPIVPVKHLWPYLVVWCRSRLGVIIVVIGEGVPVLDGRLRSSVPGIVNRVRGQFVSATETKVGVNGFDVE